MFVYKCTVVSPGRCVPISNVTLVQVVVREFVLRKTATIPVSVVKQ